MNYSKHYILTTKHIVLNIIMLLASLNLNAQIRYLDNLFEVEKMDTSMVYGEAKALKFPFLSEDKTEVQQLLMDIYQPKGDIKKNRPCILIVHGGAFMIGHRTEKNIVGIAEDMAKKGYVTASIDYRTGFNSVSGTSATRAVYRSVQDTKAAIRYLKANRQKFGIDTTHIFAFGTSAGSIAAMHAAYLDEDERHFIPASTDDLGCLSCSGNTLKHKGEPFAIANLWGAIIDTNVINRGKNIPIISFHGINDNVVSPDSINPFNLSFLHALAGTNLITPRLKNLGIETEYYKFDAGHAAWGTLRANPIYDTIIQKTTLFFYNCLQKSPLNQMEKFTYKSIKSDFSIYPNPTTEFINIDLVNYQEAFNVQIINNLGDVVLDVEVSNTAQKETIIFNVKDLIKGYYYLSITDKIQSHSQLFYKSD